MRTCLDACGVHCGDGISQFQHATDLLPGIALFDVYAAIKSYSTAAGKWIHVLVWKGDQRSSLVAYGLR
jgi:hypothetical protein